MKYSVIGAGNCFRLWESAFKELGLSFCSVCDTDKEKLKSLKYTVYTDLDELLRNDGSDCIIVTSPVSTHFEIASKIISAGKSVIVEKPVSYDFSHVESLCKMAEMRGVDFICSYHAAFSMDVEHFLANRSSLKEGLGKLLGFECVFYDPYVINGELLPSSDSLYGSYLDSAVNALSVISRVIGLDGLTPLTDPRQFLRKENLFSQTLYKKGSINGVIRTDWRLKKNLKKTLLTYEGGQILLNHSMQRIEKSLENQEPEIIDCNDCQRERLLNQYLSTIKAIESGKWDIAPHLPMYRLLLGEKRNDLRNNKA